MLELLDCEDGFLDNIYVLVNSEEYVNAIVIGWEAVIGRDYVIDCDIVNGTF